jgi:hypothetical protein
MFSFGKFSLVVAAALLAVSFASAQDGKNQVKTIILTPPEQVGCPVGMQAEHSPGLGVTVPVDKNGSVSREPIRREGQHLQLTLNNPKGSAISTVRIKVRGWSATGRTMPAQRTGSAYADASQTLDVKVNVAPHGTAKTDVWVHGMTAVDAIDLIGVKYEDGLSWRPASLQVCSIMPDPEMLISSTAKGNH